MLDYLGNDKRSHLAAELSCKNSGEEVHLMGWVHRRRDLGGLIFIDLRDVSGIVQIVFHPENNQLHQKAGKLRNEFVISVRGIVRKRDEKNINPDMLTGMIEIEAAQLKLLNNSEPLPIQINENILAEENLRLKYRYLDLRRERIQKIILQRDQIVFAIREFLTARKFHEIETPILMKSTPEGARDYL
ncbi:MAG: aspartate--tRNA ligase, partial [Candidatus Cloacimonetes bacterium]|nr:aspartate--tRNA ligase [Candidatus Cloacimonadota bacterium]